MEMLSPDQRKTVLVKGKRFKGAFLLKSHDGGTAKELLPAFIGAEALWSMDSEQVAITTCFGGSGPCVAWTTLDNDRDTPSSIVSNAFSAGHKNDLCYTNANVGALTWGKDSDRIVLIAEVPPSSQCSNHDGGHFEAFVVSLSKRKIISRFNMEETVRRWHTVLGTGLLNDIELVRKEARGTRR